MATNNEDFLNAICGYIKENCATLFGKKFWECRCVQPTLYQVKADKYDTRFFVISKFRIFFLHCKSESSIKIDKCFNILSLRQLVYSESENQLHLSWEEKNEKPFSVDLRSLEGRELYTLVINVLSTIKHYFPDVSRSLSKFLSISPTQLLNVFPLLPTSSPELPCNNFRRSYVAVCDYMKQGFKDEVIWDIERIYFTHGIRELHLEDFQHFSISDQLAIIAATQFSSYFTGLIIENVRLSPEHIETIILVVKRSHSLNILKFINSSLPREFLSQLNNSLQCNPSLPLQHLELVGHNFDDRKATYSFASSLSQIGTLRSLIFKNCFFGEKSFCNLINGLSTGIGGLMDKNFSLSHEKPRLETLCFAQNPLSANISELASLISLCGLTLSTLDLSQTSLQIDYKFWAALKFCGGHELKCLKLGECHILSSKKTSICAKDSLQLIREVFNILPKLTELDLDSAQMCPEVLTAILHGISGNATLNCLRVVLNNTFTLSSCEFASVLVENLQNCKSIASLSLYDCHLESDALRVISTLSQCQNIKCLNLGGSNFIALKNSTKKHITLLNILTELVKWASRSETLLEELELNHCHLGSHIYTVINSIGIMTRLKRLDISGNEMGRDGARLLAKSLELNQSIRVLELDQNQIGPDGYLTLSRSLKLNKILTSIPYPINDISEALKLPDRERAISAFSDIERSLQRNRWIAFSNTEDTLNFVNEIASNKTLQYFSSNCEKYRVNDSEIKKLIFYKIAKVIVTLKDERKNAKYISELNFDVNLKSSSQEFLNQLQKSKSDAQDNLVREFTEQLSSHGVKLDLDKFSINSSMVVEQVKETLENVIKRDLIKQSWEYLYGKLDAALTYDLDDNYASISIGNVPLSSKVLASPQGVINGSHRPFLHQESSFPVSQMSESTISNFGKNDSIQSGRSQRFSKISKPTPLVHLVKDRPMPARHFRNIKITSDNHEDKTPSSTTISVDSKSIEIDSSVSESNENHNKLEKLMQPIKDPSHSGTSDFPADNDSSVATPPPVPRRRSKKIAPELPPKLPVKPTKQVISPTNDLPK